MRFSFSNGMNEKFGCKQAEKYLIELQKRKRENGAFRSIERIGC